MRIVVFGGGGRIARDFAKLAKGKHQVTSVVRNNKHNDDLEAFGAYPHILDIGSATVKDVEVLLKDTNAEAIIWAAATSDEGNEELLRKVDYGGVVKVAEAAQNMGVTRFLVVSSTDAHPPNKMPSYYNEASRASSETFWALKGPYILSKYDAEAAVQKTNLDFTVIRPGLLHDEPRGKAEMGVLQIAKAGVPPPKTVSDLLAAVAPCARELVAETLMHCLAQPGTARLTFTVLDGEHDAGKQVELQVAEQTDLFKIEAYSPNLLSVSSKKKSQSNTGGSGITGTGTQHAPVDGQFNITGDQRYDPATGRTLPAQGGQQGVGQQGAGITGTGTQHAPVEGQFNITGDQRYDPATGRTLPAQGGQQGAGITGTGTQHAPVEGQFNITSDQRYDPATGSNVPGQGGNEQLIPEGVTNPGGNSGITGTGTRHNPVEGQFNIKDGERYDPATGRQMPGAFQ